MKNIKTIINSLNSVNISCNLKKRYYKLSYSVKSYNRNKYLNDPQDMNVKDMKWYFEENYKNNFEGDRGKLINDLIIFKTFKEDLELKILRDSFTLNCLSVVISIFAVIFASESNIGRIFSGEIIDDNPKKIIFRENVLERPETIGIVLIAIMLLFLIIYMMQTWDSKHYFSNKLRTVNNIVFSLENLKDYINEK
ncbi:MAG: hypothetical protein E6315_00795 [Peptoniphilus harei]|nr:hypothetical protein [Peptoniphilus harei]